MVSLLGCYEQRPGYGLDDGGLASDNDAQTQTDAAQNGVSLCTPSMPVVAYHPSWTGDPNAVRWQMLTHLNYAFVLPEPDGTLRPLENPEKLRALVANAELFGVKVLIAVGGYNQGDDSAFHAIAPDPARRQTFVESLQELVDEYQLDGVDIDWEYPERPQDAPDFTALMADLSANFRPQNKLITIAVGATTWGTAGITPDAYEYIDYVYLMAYDAQLDDDPNHSPYSYAMESLDHWQQSKQLPAEKTVLGVPFYARPSYTSYAALVAVDETVPDKDEHGGQYYNGMATMEQKALLAKERAAGVMVWEITQDTKNSTSLLNVICEASNL